MRRSALVIILVAALSAGMGARADEAPPQRADQTPPAETPAQPPPQGSAQAPPQPTIEAPPPQSTTQTPPQSAVQSVAPEEAEAILGQRVMDQEGKDIGRLVDVLVDANGQPQAAVIDFGGFMGVGNRKIAVHWSTLRFNPGDLKHKVTLEMTPDQIKAAPEFLNPDKAAPVVTPASAAPTSP
jgi:PRC-barrel domain